MTGPKYIEPKEIRGALSALWEKNKGTNLTRASLFNLVIYAKKDYREEYLNKIARKIIRKFPCRLIFITEYEDAKEDFLKTYVSELKPDEGSASIFCDSIHFEVGGNQKEIIPFVLLPHFLPNLPIYLLWGDDPSKRDPIAKKLESYATRTIFDSESSENISTFAKTLLKLHKELPSDLTDLNWGRCAPWRELFAQVFNSEKHFATLENVKEIHITYNAHLEKNFSHSRIQSIYLQGWLASKMGWSFESLSGSEDSPIFTYKGPKHAITIHLKPGESRLVQCGRILGVDLFSKGHHHVSLKRIKHMMHKVSIERSTPSLCEMPTFFLLNKESSGQSLTNEIYNKGTNETFLKVLRLLSDLVQEEVLST